MAGRTLFNFRVLECPSCAATLPVNAGDTIVECEYCDARVQVARAKSPEPPPRPPSRHDFAPPPGYAPQPLSAKPHASAFAWILFSLAITLGVGGAIAFFVYRTVERTGAFEQLEKLAEMRSAAKASRTAAPPKTPASNSAAQNRAEARAKSEALATAKAESQAKSKSKSKSKTKTKTKTKTKSKSKSASAPAPTGPVLSVSDAEKAIKAKVLTCMRDQKVHDILAYMGNSKVGGVKVLSRHGTRVDGLAKQIKGTKLGKCMDKAGGTIRARAFKSNYLRFQLVNDAVPDPHGHLPAKHDRTEVNRIIATVDDKILACAKKHGEEGAKEVFYFVIDGPTGKPTRVDASYRGRSFKKCAEPIYKKLSFPKVQESTIKVTKHLQM